MNTFSLISFLLCIIISCTVGERVIFTLNTEAYTTYYTTNCGTINNIQYEATCRPFTASELWSPNGIPSNNDTVIVTSDTPIDLVVQAEDKLVYHTMNINGHVNLIVQGNLTLPHRRNAVDVFPGLNITGNSSLSIQYKGTFSTYTTYFYDSASLYHNSTRYDRASFSVSDVYIRGEFNRFYISSGMAVLNTIGVLEFLNISGNASTTRDPGFERTKTMYLSVSGTSNINRILEVMKGGTLIGIEYSLYGLYIHGNSSLEIDSCSNSSLNFIYAYSHSRVTIKTDNIPPGRTKCYPPDLNIYDYSTLILNGNNDIEIKSLSSNNFYYNLTKTATISFISSSSNTVNVAINRSSSYFYATFDGNFDVIAGGKLYNSWDLAGISITNGHVKLTAISVSIVATFELDPNLSLILPSGGELTIRNCSFSLSNPNFMWEPNSLLKVVGGTINATDFTLSNGKTIEMSHISPTQLPSFNIQNFIIEEGAVLRILYNCTGVGNVELRGLLDINGYMFAKLDLQGNLAIGRTGVLWLPQSIGHFTINYGDNPDQSSFISASGQISLGGTLNCTVTGTIYTPIADFKLERIPVMQSATRVVNKFNSFTTQMAYYTSVVTENSLNVDYKVDQNTVFLNFERKTSSGNHLYPVLSIFIVVIFGLLM